MFEKNSAEAKGLSHKVKVWRLNKRHRVRYTTVQAIIGIKSGPLIVPAIIRQPPYRLLDSG
jgi:hypothetical protein